MEAFFYYISFLDGIWYFEILLVLISFIYLHLPLPLSVLLIFNSIYFKEYSFLINLILVNLSYISTYQLIQKLNINKSIEKFILKKIKKRLFYVNNSNKFIKAFFLRFIIPYPLLNYFFSVTNYSFRHSVLATFISLIPVIYLLSSSSKDLISGRGFILNYYYLVIYIIYASIIYLVHKFISKNLLK